MNGRKHLFGKKSRNSVSWFSLWYKRLDNTMKNKKLMDAVKVMSVIIIAIVCVKLIIYFAIEYDRKEDHEQKRYRYTKQLSTCNIVECKIRYTYSNTNSGHHINQTLCNCHHYQGSYY